jgi:Tol biopolymer transport system component
LQPPTESAGHRSTALLALASVAILALTAACAGQGGTASLGGTSVSLPASLPSAPTAGAAAGASAAGSPSLTSSAALSSAQLSSAPPSSAALGSAQLSSGAPTKPVAVVGIPHVDPLAGNILVVTRILDGTADLYQIDTTTGAVGKRLTVGRTSPQLPVLSPDRGSLIYLQAGDESPLRTMAADGTGDRQLFANLPEGCKSVQRPAWNPVDGSELAVICTIDDGTNKLFLMDVDGTVRSTLRPGIAHIDDVAYSPDGKSVTYWGAQDGNVPGGALFVQATAPDGIPRQLTTPGAATDADPVFSPDGKTIAFRRANAGNSQILTINVDGSGLKPISDGTAFDQDPIYSPDGTQIAFKSNRNNAAGTSDNQIWVMAIDGSGLHQLGVGSRGNSEGAPAWGHR